MMAQLPESWKRCRKREEYDDEAELLATTKNKQKRPRCDLDEFGCAEIADVAKLPMVMQPVRDEMSLAQLISQYGVLKRRKRQEIMDAYENERLYSLCVLETDELFKDYRKRFAIANLLECSCPGKRGRIASSMLTLPVFAIMTDRPGVASFVWVKDEWRGKGLVNFLLNALQVTEIAN